MDTSGRVGAMTGLLDKPTLLVLTILFAAVTTAAPRAEELLFWPYMLDGAFGRTQLGAGLSGALGSVGSPANGLNFHPVSPLIDSQWADFTSEFNRNADEGHALKNARTFSTEPADQFLLGGSRLGIQTEKSLRTSDPLRRTECATDDECADYSSLPKSEPGKRNLKTLRKPFIGLSIIRPLQ